MSDLAVTTPAPPTPVLDPPRLATLCTLCGLHEMKSMQGSDVTYCPHCDRVCGIHAEACPACLNVRKARQ